MKRSTRKKRVLLAGMLLTAVCAVGLAGGSMTAGMRAAAETEQIGDDEVPRSAALGAPSGTSKEAEIAEMHNTPVATPSEPDPGKEVGTVTVRLEAGEGSLSGSDDTVTLYMDGTFPELPVPTREGWTFKGWYTKEVKEVFLDGGDPHVNNEAFDPAELTKGSAVKGKIESELKQAGIPVEAAEGDAPNGDITQLHHSWYIYTPKDSKMVKADDKLPEDVTVLYAMYRPEKIVITMMMNGWQNQYNSSYLDSYQSYGSVFFAPDLGTSRSWNGRVFLGWSTEPKGEVLLKPNYTYIVGDDQLPIGQKNMKLYAIWEGGESIETVGLTAYNDKGRSTEKMDYRSTLKVEYYPKDKDGKSSTLTLSSVEWETDRPDIISIKDSGSLSDHYANISTGDGKGITEPVTVTIKVTVTDRAGKAVSMSRQITVGHEWYNGKVTIQPSCKKEGTVHYYCYHCGVNVTYQEQMPRISHTFTSATVPPTCTEDGYQEKVCTVCGYTEKSVTSPAAGHTWGQYHEVRSCSGMVTTHVCSVCGYSETHMDADSAAHQWEAQPTVDKAPTCTEAGSQSYHCALCEVTKDSTVIPADPSLHDWTDWTKWRVTKKTDDGVTEEVRERKCRVCGAVEQEENKIIGLPKLEQKKDSEAEPETEPAPETKEEPETEPETKEEPGTQPEPETQPETKAEPETEAQPETKAEPETSASSGSGSSSGSSGSSGGGSGSRSSGGGGGSSSRSSGGGGGGGSRSSGGGGGSSSSGKSSTGTTTTAPTVPASVPADQQPSAEVLETLPTYVEVGSWTEAEDGSWTFSDSDGEAYTDRWAAIYNPYANTAAGVEAYDWFRFDETGHLITGWYTDPADGCVYYMNPLSDGTKGKMMTGWVMIDGKEYYFNPYSDGTRGRMYCNEMTPDGHFVGPDGAKVY